jgi:hypothetical protein
MSRDGPLVATTEIPAAWRILMPAARSPRLRHSRDVWKTTITSNSPRRAAAIMAS